MKNDIKRYICEKKSVFKDFHIPWDTSIEDHLKDELTKHPEHDIIMKRLEVI